MEQEPAFYDEDLNEVFEAVTYLTAHKGVPRMDLKLEGNKTAKVYWVGQVLRIDIEGLK